MGLRQLGQRIHLKCNDQSSSHLRAVLHERSLPTLTFTMFPNATSNLHSEPCHRVICDGGAVA